MPCFTVGVVAVQIVVTFQMAVAVSVEVGVGVQVVIGVDISVGVLGVNSVHTPIVVHGIAEGVHARVSGQFGVKGVEVSSLGVVLTRLEILINMITVKLMCRMCGIIL